MFGKILRVDLTSKSYEIENLEEDFVRKYLGGRGLGAKILYDELKPGTDPLSPENLFIIATGLLTGSKAPSGSRYSITTKNGQIVKSYDQLQNNDQITTRFAKGKAISTVVKSTKN